LPMGPAQRVQQAFSDVQRAQQFGSPAQVFDARYQLSMAEERLGRAMSRGSDNFAAKLAGVVSSSRISLGPGGLPQIMPLVGRVAGLLGPEVAEMLSPWGVAIGAAVTGLHVFAQEVGAAAGAAIRFGQAQTLSGGTAQEVSRLTSMGLDSSQIAPAAARLHERLSSDPFAMAAGMRLGIGPQLPRPFGGVDEAGTLVRVVDALRGVTDQEERLQLARMLGAEELLKFTQISSRVWAAMKRDAETTRGVFDERTVQNARDLEAEITRYDNALQNFRGSLVKGALPGVVQDIDDFANALNYLAQGATQNQGALQDFWTGFRQGLVSQFPFLQTLLPIGRAAGQAQPGPDPAKQAQDDNTRALDALTAAIRQLGGGQRSAGAIPIGLRAADNRQQAIDAGLDLRGFRSFGGGR
jgi:hypothetical protein